MDGPGYLRALRSGWLVLLCGLVLGGAVGWLSVHSSAPTYTTDMRFFIATASADSTASAYEGNLFSQQRVTSYAEVVTDQQLLGAVVQDLNLTMTAQQLADHISASVVPNTVILDVTVQDTSPTRAVAIARTVGREFTATVTRLETPPGSDRSTVAVHVIAAPQLPTTPSSPRPTRDIAIAAVLGLLLSAAVVVVRSRLDTRLSDVEQTAQELDAPLLGVVLRDGELSRKKVLPPLSVSPTAEGLRQIGTNLDFLDVDRPPRVLTVTSALAGEGKTTLATNLACQLAEDGRRVVLVDADLRRPRVARFLGLPGGAGLSNVLNGSAELEDVLQEAGSTGRLRVLAAGARVPNPGALLGSERMQKLLETLLESGDIVILDAPPVLPVADTSRLAPHTDGVLFCARWRTARRKDLRVAGRTLAGVQARLLGVVVTSLPRGAAPAYGYGYGYSYQRDRSWRMPSFLRPGAGSVARVSDPATAPAPARRGGRAATEGQ